MNFLFVQESFDNLHRWFDEIEAYADKNVKKMLVGNKCDLTDKRVIDFNTAKV